MSTQPVTCRWLILSPACSVRNAHALKTRFNRGADVCNFWTCDEKTETHHMQGASVGLSPQQEVVGRRFGRCARARVCERAPLNSNCPEHVYLYDARSVAFTAVLVLREMRRPSSLAYRWRHSVSCRLIFDDDKKSSLLPVDRCSSAKAVCRMTVPGCHVVTASAALMMRCFFFFETAAEHGKDKRYDGECCMSRCRQHFGLVIVAPATSDEIWFLGATDSTAPKMKAPRSKSICGVTLRWQCSGDVITESHF